MIVKIPVELCEYVIRNNFYRPMQLYIYLKLNTSGQVRSGDLRYDEIAKAIGLTTGRAVRNNMKLLLEKNWVGYNKKSKYYFIRGFKKIMQICGFSSKTAAVFDSVDILKLKAFVSAVRIAYLINKQKRKKWATELVKGCSNHIARSSSQYYPLANEALAKVLEISISTAYQLKLLASKAGYIHIKKTFQNTSFAASEASLFKRGHPEIAKKVITNTGNIQLQGIDMVAHSIKFSRRKKLETYKKGVIGGMSVKGV